MLSGIAQAPATEAYARAFPGIAFSSLGNTGLTVSQAGFGGYRITAQVEEHGRALKKALASGINIIDTSSNYTDGESEALMGRVLTELTADHSLDRAQVVVVTKAGYLQGQNLLQSRKRRARGQPYAEVVPYGQGLEHCIHPEFLSDQLEQSLGRLNLEAVDVFLLHNPEYYLAWAHNQDIAAPQAEAEYYRRLQQAFCHLEKEADKGRIRFYGVSSNTFPIAGSQPDFTSLEKLWDMAQALSPDHRFRVIQLPLNLLESGAVLEKNQSQGLSVLEFARQKSLGVLINRPLNAISGQGLTRLAAIAAGRPPSKTKVQELWLDLMDSEDQLKTSLLPNLDLEPLEEKKTAELLSVGQALVAAWAELQGREHWRGLESNYFLPRINSAVRFLAQNLRGSQEGLAVLDAHLKRVQAAFEAVGLWYAAQAAELAQKIKEKAAACDRDWAQAPNLSQMAVRAVRSTPGVGSVLVGMRRQAYVDDVLQELGRSLEPKPRNESWLCLQQALDFL
ncbi:MAG: aldo/keto reductase [Desulfarculaceae bacterium]